MSRITTDPVSPGDDLNAASLNTRFSAYNQTDLNQFNHRDAAHDLPQLSTGFLLTHAQTQTIGLNDYKHGSFVTVSGMTSMPHVGSPVANGSGAVSEMSFGSGLTVDNDELLRAYWDLSVFANPGSNWDSATSLGFYTLPDGSLGTRKTSTWGACWVLYLEWDITSAARAAYVPVSGQSDFRTAIGSKFGAALADTQASCVVPADLRYADRPTGATGVALLPRPSVQSTQAWRGISGAWFYTPAGATTIYGLRVVIKGIMHPHSVGTANYLVHDTGYSNGASLSYNGGNLSVLKQRVK
tara:strand:+ start:4319 stop:5212 length:894 start_codon:yes stop_codon:yes gene_type:complete